MPGSEPWSAGDLADRSVDDFRAGTADDGLYLARTAGAAEVILRPAAAAEFDVDGLPAHWYSEPWKEGGKVEHRNGAIQLEAATVGLHGLYPSERSLEFRATFRKRPHQHVGFGTNFRTVPWITFSTKFGHGLYARTNFVIPEENRLPTSLLGSPHRFRIEWNVLEVEFYVDGRRAAHQLVPMVGYMRPLASNASLAPDPLEVEWMRMSPYASEGRFTSRVHDAGAPVVWTGCEIDADVPPLTRLAVERRAGDGPAPDDTWSPWTGPDGTVRGRFAQYRLTLETDNPRWTPALRAVTLSIAQLHP